MDGQEHVNEWLRRHRVPDLELTPLVAARIGVRHRADRIENLLYLVALAFLVVTAVVQVVLERWFELDAPALSVLLIGVGYLLLSAATGVVFWRQRRGDRLVADGLPRRVTRSQAASLVTVLGGRILLAAAVVYGGGLLVGAGGAALARSAVDRQLAGAFLVGTALCAAVIVWLLADVVRRPAIADDEPSLRADDRLRRVDASRSVVPYPVPLAAIVAVASSEGSALLWVFLGYAVVAAVAWGLTTARATQASVGPRERVSPSGGLGT